jgi:ubiquinone/menaquinone biosynthesis C-methylase UbiE
VTVFKFPSENWQALLNPEREKWQSTEVFLERVKPFPEEVWVDLGCGPGYFTIPLASKCKKVYAVDSEDKMLEICQQRVKQLGLETKVKFIKCSEEEIPLADGVADRVLMANLLHELLYPSKFLSEVKRISKSNAEIIVIDWHPIPSPAGPPIEERIPEDRAVELLESNGFVLTERLNVFPYHYFLVLTKEVPS